MYSSTISEASPERRMKAILETSAVSTVRHPTAPDGKVQIHRAVVLGAGDEWGIRTRGECIEVSSPLLLVVRLQDQVV
jgi:hypothetical protein